MTVRVQSYDLLLDRFIVERDSVVWLTDRMRRDGLWWCDRCAERAGAALSVTGERREWLCEVCRGE